MYAVITVSTQDKVCFETLESAVDYVAKKVKEEVTCLYENDVIDKYAVEDALWDLKKRIIENNGYSHPDVCEEWKIKESANND